MKKMIAKLDSLLIKAKMKIRQFAEDESGMEVIQMLVLLALGLALIGVFIGFKEEIMGKVTELVEEFMGDFN